MGPGVQVILEGLQAPCSVGAEPDCKGPLGDFLHVVLASDAQPLGRACSLPQQQDASSFLQESHTLGSDKREGGIATLWGVHLQDLQADEGCPGSLVLVRELLLYFDLPHVSCGCHGEVWLGQHEV